MTKNQKTILYGGVGLALGLVIFTSNDAKEFIALSSMRIRSGAVIKLSEVRTYPESPGRWYVPLESLLTLKDGKTAIHVLRGSLFDQPNQGGYFVVSKGETRDGL